MKRSRTRRRIVTVMAMASLMQGLGLSYASGRAPVPPTVARSVGVPLASIVGRTPRGGLSVSRSGVVRAARATTTAPEVVCSPIWFTATALLWRQPSGGIVQADLAVGRERGRFGAAQVLASDPEEGPGPGTAEYHPFRAATDLLWTGGGRCIPFAMKVPAGTEMAGLRAVFVNTSGTAAGPGTGPSEVSPSGIAARPLAAQSAEAGPLRPAMVTRRQWGANPKYFDSAPGCSAPYYAPRLKMAFIHHTAGSNSYSPSQSDDIVRAIYWYHTRVRKYCDIAYNFLVDRYGKVFVGRAGGVSRPMIPASQEGFNTDTFSVSTIGNWQTATPPAVMVRSVERLLSWRLDIKHLPPTGSALMTSGGGATTRYPAGTKVRLHLMSGHRDTGLTACPGARFYPLLPGIRRTVNAMGGPKVYRPAESSPQVTPLKRSTTFTAWANESLTWRVSVTDRSGDVYTTMYRSGTALHLSWNGTDASGAPLRPGVYRVVIGGADTNGGRARPAVLPIAVNPAPAGPSPTPTSSP